MRKNVHDGHRERLREKVKKSGMEGLADHEKLEYLLYPFVPRRDTNPIAHSLIATFGSLRGVLDADIRDIAAVKGVSENAALFLHSLPDLFLCYSNSGPKKVLKNTFDAAHYAMDLIGNSEHERILCFFIKQSGEVIKIMDLARGNRRAVVIDRGELIRLSVQCKAELILLAHNHPSGELYPSTEDVVATNLLAQSLQIVNIRLWDHVIVTATGFFSMCDNGMISLPVDYDKPMDSLKKDLVKWSDSVSGISGKIEK